MTNERRQDRSATDAPHVSPATFDLAYVRLTTAPDALTDQDLDALAVVSSRMALDAREARDRARKAAERFMPEWRGREQELVTLGFLERVIGDLSDALRTLSREDVAAVVERVRELEDRLRVVEAGAVPPEPEPEPLAAGLA